LNPGGGDKIISNSPPADYEREIIVNDAGEIENPFSDTNLNFADGTAAADCYWRGIIGGYEVDGVATPEFRGEQTVKRVEAAKFLLLGTKKSVNPDKIYKSEYSAEEIEKCWLPDLKSGEWYVPYAMSACDAGIMNGKSKG